MLQKARVVTTKQPGVSSLYQQNRKRPKTGLHYGEMVSFKAKSTKRLRAWPVSFDRCVTITRVATSLCATVRYKSYCMHANHKMQQSTANAQRTSWPSDKSHRFTLLIGLGRHRRQHYHKYQRQYNWSQQLQQWIRCTLYSHYSKKPRSSTHLSMCLRNILKTIRKVVWSKIPARVVQTLVQNLAVTGN